MEIKSTTHQTGTAASANITVPASTVEGDWIVLFIHSNYSLSMLNGMAFVEAYKSNTNYRGLYVGYRQASTNDAGTALSMTFAGSEPYYVKLYVIDGKSVGSIAGGTGIANSNIVNHNISYSFSAGQEVLLSASNRASTTLNFNQGTEIERTTYNSGKDLYIAARNSAPLSQISVSGSGSGGATLGFVVFCDTSYTPPSETLIFSYIGKVQPHIFEAGKYRIRCYGAQGGNGGQGGYSEGILDLQQDTVAFIRVGGMGSVSGAAGWGGGGNIYTGSNSGGGGGASDIRIGTDSLFSRIIVAGGGGGRGHSTSAGGAGGGIDGANGQGSGSYGEANGGTQTAGGNKSSNSGSYQSTSGTFGSGGQGYGNTGGGGGGGWYGGGGATHGGGAGGSGYVLTADSFKPDGYLLGAEYYLTETILTQGGRIGDGLIIIEVVEVGVQKFLARDAEGIKAWHGEIVLPKPVEVISEQWNENTGGTTLSSSVSAIVGASVVAVVTTRSDTVFSAGWELISSEYGFSTSNQNLYVFIKTAESTNESIAVTQTASARIYIQLVAFNKRITLSEQWRMATPGDTVTTFSVPDKPEKAEILWTLSANMWTTSGTYGKWNTSPDDLTRYSALTNVQDRQAVFFDSGTGATRGRSFTSITSTGVGCIMFRIMDFDNNDKGYWEFVGDTVSEELFVDYGSERIPQSTTGLLDDAEILLWTDRQNIVENPLDYDFVLTLNATPPTQTITQTMPFDLPEGAAVNRILLVTDELNGGTVSSEYSVNGNDITFTYTLEKPTVDAVAGIKKINIYFTEE